MRTGWWRDLVRTSLQSHHSKGIDTGCPNRMTLEHRLSKKLRSTGYNTHKRIKSGAKIKQIKRWPISPNKCLDDPIPQTSKPYCCCHTFEVSGCLWLMWYVISNSSLAWRHTTLHALENTYLHLGIFVSTLYNDKLAHKSLEFNLSYFLL